jgi:aerobic carbon-monoxide dehydrogenase medium subunit
VKAAPFQLARPTSLDEALALLGSGQGDRKAIAGGQSLIPMMAFRMARPDFLVDLARVPGLDAIEIGPDGVRLGGRVRWRDIEQDARLASAHPLLVAAVSHVAHYQIRNRGTVGGSCAHADPAAELPGVALACEATLLVRSSRGTRSIPAEEFFLGPLTTALEPDELIVQIRLPPWPTGRRWAFEEFSRRKGDFALIGVAAFFDLDADGRCVEPRIAAIGAADRPIRLRTVEEALRRVRPNGDLLLRAGELARAEVDPASDIHAPAEYRKALTGVLVERALLRAAGLSGTGDRP